MISFFSDKSAITAAAGFDMVARSDVGSCLRLVRYYLLGLNRTLQLLNNVNFSLLHVASRALSACIGSTFRCGYRKHVNPEAFIFIDILAKSPDFAPPLWGNFSLWLSRTRVHWWFFLTILSRSHPISSEQNLSTAGEIFSHV